MELGSDDQFFKVSDDFENEDFLTGNASEEDPFLDLDDFSKEGNDEDDELTTVEDSQPDLTKMFNDLQPGAIEEDLLPKDEDFLEAKEKYKDDGQLTPAEIEKIAKKNRREKKIGIGLKADAKTKKSKKKTAGKIKAKGKKK